MNQVNWKRILWSFKMSKIVISLRKTTRTNTLWQFLLRIISFLSLHPTMQITISKELCTMLYPSYGDQWQKNIPEENIKWRRFWNAAISQWSGNQSLKRKQRNYSVQFQQRSNLFRLQRMNPNALSHWGLKCLEILLLRNLQPHLIMVML